MKSAAFLFSTFYFLVFAVSAQTSKSVLSEGEFYKLAIAERGIYKMDKKYLSSLGIDIANIDPRTIKIYGNGGGMLPQVNQAPRPDDLLENAIVIAGEEDGKFDEEDYILFYAEGPDEPIYDPSGEVFRTQKNLFTEENYYFLVISNTVGKRITTKPSIYGISGLVATFDDYINHESDEFNLLSSGREWFGEAFGEQSTHHFTYQIAGILPESTTTIAAAVISQTSYPTHYDFTINQLQVGTLKAGIASSFEYGYKGVEASGILTAQNIFTDADPELRLEISLREGSNSLGYLNYFSINFERALRLYGNITFFRSLKSTNRLISEFQISDAGEGDIIWDITSPQAVENQAYNLNSGNIVRFKAYSENLKEYVIFRGNDFPAPMHNKKISPQNLHGLPTPELLIITHPLFASEAERLAEFRRQHDNLTVAVVPTEEIYNEFSSGKQDVSAIRDFIRFLYLRSDENAPLRYVLLFGDASYDFKRKDETNTNFVPVYQSRNSLHNVLSYSSDDYFGFMDADEGEWPETTSSNPHDLEIAVGRLPVKSKAEANILVDKLTYYSSNTNTLGEWRNKIAFIADDGDQNKHQYQSDFLADFIDNTYHNLNASRVFIDAYPQDADKNIQSPAVRQRINDHIQKGVLIMDYIGHGGETAWANEQILDLDMIKKWNNYNNMPLILSATCEFGRYDDPQRSSGAEVALLNPEGGAIALFTTTRPVFPNTIIYLNKAFYESAFFPIDGQMPRLGDIFRKTKNVGVSGNTNRNFSLLGDPSMRLAYPQKDIVITEIKDNVTNEQSRIRPVSNITMRGEVRSKGTVSTDFNGLLHVIVYDRETAITTFGDEGSPPMEFHDRQDIIFKGRATVKNGEFSFTFVAPRSLDESLAYGKVSLYASHKSKYEDATGSYINLEIGGAPTNIAIDNTPPKIRLFMDSDSFRSGAKVSPNTTLNARLSDESGINTNNGKGNGISAILNNDIANPVELTEFFTTDIDSYQEGSISYQFHGLPSGRHDILLKASDNFNNRASAFIEFYVLDGNVLFVHEIIAYPNPSRDDVNFRFSLDNAIDDFKVNLKIYSLNGKLVRQFHHDFTNSADKNTLTWDRTDSSGYRMHPGIYLFSIVFESDQQTITYNVPLQGKIVLLD